MDNNTIMTANTAFTVTKNNIPKLPSYVSNYIQAEISKAARAGKFLCDIDLTSYINDDVLFTRILNTLELLGYEVRTSSMNTWNNTYEFTVMWRKF